MWYLIEEDPAQKPAPHHWLGGTAGGGRTIGRKHVNIRLKVSSVSRTHAKITVHKAAFYTPTGADVRRLYQSTSVCVQDSSAYGTFLKYPAGHASNRGENVVGHHRRLDKDTPTDVREGALLAFGAPSSWWRVGWHPLVLYATRVSEQERARLAEVAALTSLEVATSWSDEVTHLVTNQCVASNLKFLTALVQGKGIVTIAWVETVCHTVSNASSAIAEAASETWAATASRLSEECHYAPSFSPADEAQYSVEVLAAVFEPSRRERRRTLLKGIILAFAQDERRAKWAAIIEALGGTAMLAKAVAPSHEKDSRVIYVQPDQSGARRERESTEALGRHYIPVTALIESILRADVAPLNATVGESKATTTEAVDVATPGPLEVDTGIESDDSEPVNVENVANTDARPFAEEEKCADEGEGILRKRAAACKKRRRRRAELSRDKNLNAKKARNEATEGQLTERPKLNANDDEPMIENSDINPVGYFKLRDVQPAPEALQSQNAADDVRLFRRRNVPTAPRVPLQRVRYVDEALASSYEPPVEQEEDAASASGARVLSFDD